MYLLQGVISSSFGATIPRPSVVCFARGNCGCVCWLDVASAVTGLTVLFRGGGSFFSYIFEGDGGLFAFDCLSIAVDVLLVWNILRLSGALSCDNLYDFTSLIFLLYPRRRGTLFHSLCETGRNFPFGSFVSLLFERGLCGIRLLLVFLTR